MLRQDAPSCPRSSFFTVTLKKGSGPAEEGSGENASGLTHSRNISEPPRGRGGAPTRLCGEKARGEAGPQREWGCPPEQPGTACPGKPAYPGQRGCLLPARPQSKQAKEATGAERGLNLHSPRGLVLRAVGVSPPTLQSVRSHLAPPSALALPRRPMRSQAQLSRPRAPRPGRGDEEGRHPQGPTCRVAAGLGQDVGALAHEVKVPPVEGEVMRVSIDEAGGSACRGDVGDA